MTLAVKITLALALILGIAVPFGAFAAGEKTRGRYKAVFSGFHSETEEDHALSLSLMEECGYDAAFMFKYSERPGTYASRSEEHTSELQSRI